MVATRPMSRPDKRMPLMIQIIIMMMMKVTKETITLARKEVLTRRRIKPPRNNRKIRREAENRRREVPKLIRRSLASPPRVMKLLKMMVNKVPQKVLIRGKKGRKPRQWMVINRRLNRII